LFSPVLKYLNEENDETLGKIITPWQWIKDLLQKFGDQHFPLFDLDGDAFSVEPTFRGYHWRGKDCDDYNKHVYPGRKTYHGLEIGKDYNCNGIHGFDFKAMKTWKKKVCNGSG